VISLGDTLEQLGLLKRFQVVWIAIRNWSGFRRDLAEFKRQRASASSPHLFAEAPDFPCLHDKDAPAGSAEGQYFHQDLLVARKIWQNNPRRHLDVGSRIDGFVAHVAAFRKIEIVDIRPLKAEVHNISVRCLDLSAPLPLDLIAYCDSLSCLHALEHFGLGRFGDTVKYTGYLDGLENLYRILEPGGKFYFSVPLGPQRIHFNAHRVFSARYLWDLLTPRYRIDTFSFVDDAGALTENVDLNESTLRQEIDRNFGCFLGCGIFELTKLG
jgi:SAM-dependent methyltransferase